MEFLDLLAKPIQVVKDVLDLNDDLEAPSLASQFVAIKHQLEKVQEQLDESHRIAHEKDLVIAKLQRAVAAKAQPRPSAPAFVRYGAEPPVRADEATAPVMARMATTSQPYAVAQTNPDEAPKLPHVPSCEAAAQQARSQCSGAAAQATPAPAEPKSSAPATAEATKTTRRTRKTAQAGGATVTDAKPKKTTRAGKQATNSAAKKSARTTKRATAGQAEPTSTPPPARTKARKTASSRKKSRTAKN